MGATYFFQNSVNAGFKRLIKNCSEQTNNPQMFYPSFVGQKMFKPNIIMFVLFAMKDKVHMEVNHGLCKYL